MDMFCYQCEQTAKGVGCDRHGVCGKSPEVAKLLDLLVYATKGIAGWASRAAELGARDDTVDRFVIEALFTTVTNVNFDPGALVARLQRVPEIRDKARALYEKAAREKGKTPEALDGVAVWDPAATREGLLAQAEEVSLDRRKAALGETVVGLQELILYGLKGAAAYADHARVLGKTDPSLYARFHALLDFLRKNPTDVETLLATALQTGELNLQVMALLDAANTGAYGTPEPTPVRIDPVRGKAIVVSGHDLKDLKMLLEQTEGSGINVYTHGEMLPCHGYPELKKHKHLVGNYGGAWQDQQKEFDALPGAVLMTTNCLQKPRESYKDRIFTTGLVGWPGTPHIEENADGSKDFTPVIEAAKAAPGFTEDGPGRTILVGFGHDAVLGVADKVIEAVKAGAVRHFFLVGGCDGAKPGRNYYTDFARAVPDDCIILTLACGKYRFNKEEFGEIGGLPRLLDVGQCNDAYSAIRIATALAEAFDCGVNDLPLSLVLSWYEQKAVAILLTLLHLGIKDIRLGPTLPAFVTPEALQVLVDSFGIKPTTEAAQDLNAILAPA